MTFRPLYDRVLVQCKTESSVSEGGLYLPQNSKKKPDQGEILAVGIGKRSDSGEIIPLTLSVGDLVVFGKFSGTEIRLGEQDLLILREDDVLGVL